MAEAYRIWPCDSFGRRKSWFPYEADGLLVLTASVKALEMIIVRVEAMHGSEMPAILALPVIGGSEAYLNWLGGQLAAE